MPDFKELLGGELGGALERRGFSALTDVQRSVLDPALEGRDLRISSQTGSGKTLAIAFAVRAEVVGDASAADGVARPFVLVVTPTRELATQVQEELSWFFGAVGVRVASVIGGGSYRDERRAFAAGPAIVVGTPGRLCDHLERGALDASQIRAVALDEADRMLDLGFRDDIEKIFALLPEERRSHLVSATFPREVKALADSIQRDPVRVEGTPLGSANADIDHVVHLVANHERLAAIVNLLLARPEGQTLIFARTRADVADMTDELRRAGFSVAALSGEMEQRERNRALAAFKAGGLHALVATDVAARGIDVQDIARVVHAEPPNDPDTYTHRSGRTGRAGRKGTSAVLTVPQAMRRVTFLLKRAGVAFRIEPIPRAAEVRRAVDERFVEELTQAAEQGTTPPDARSLEIARRIAASEDLEIALARLVARARAHEPFEPREVTPIEWRDPDGRRDRGDRRSPEPRGDRPRLPKPEGGWTSFRISWGQTHGADARRLLAMVCRRGGVRGSDVGNIRVARAFSVVDIASDAAPAFERAVRAPDPRDPRITIRRFEGEPFEPHGRREEESPVRREERFLRRDDGPKERPSSARGRRDDIPKERPSRARVQRDDVPKGRPSRDRAQRDDLPKERPSRARVQREEPPKDRPSRARTPGEGKSRGTGAGGERPSRGRFERAERPSRDGRERGERPRHDERPRHEGHPSRDRQHGAARQDGPKPEASRDRRPSADRPPSRDDKRRPFRR